MYVWIGHNDKSQHILLKMYNVSDVIFVTHLMGTRQTVYFNLRTSSSKNKVRKYVTFSLLPVHVSLVTSETRHSLWLGHGLGSRAFSKKIEIKGIISA